MPVCCSMEAIRFLQHTYGSFFVKSATFLTDHLQFFPNFTKTLVPPGNLKLAKKKKFDPPLGGRGGAKFSLMLHIRVTKMPITFLFMKIFTKFQRQLKGEQ